MKSSPHRVMMTVPAALGGAALIFAFPTSTPMAHSVAAQANPVRTSAAAMAATDDKVDTLAYANGVVYAGGLFTHVTFNGTRRIRNHLAAVRAATGAPTPFRPHVNGEVMALALSPNKKRLYVGGRFTDVGGAPRTNIAAFSTSTGRLTSFAPVLTGGAVRAIAVTHSGVYLGGAFTSVGGRSRTFAAEVTRQGRVTRWAPKLDGWVHALLISPDKTRIFLGGGFHHSNGVAREALASVNLTNGANKRFRNKLIPTYTGPGRFSQVTSFSTDGRLIYAGAEGRGVGVFDGTLAFRPRTGKLVWRNRCLGATQAVLYLRGVLYKASHAHDCSRSGGFGPIRRGWQPHRLLAENPANGRLIRWGTSARYVALPVPNTNGGLYNALGPFALATDGRQLFVGGEFTEVNGKAQEGLARFRSRRR